MEAIPVLFAIVNLGIQVLVVVLGVVFHLRRHRQDRSLKGTFEALIPWIFFAFVGLGGVQGFFFHAFAADMTAELIGWPAGNPFQFEVAVANLSYGVLGLLSLRYHGKFWWATATAYTVFLWGDAVGHIYQLIVNNNRAPGNAGFVLYADILIPFVLLAMLLVHLRIQLEAEEAGKLTHIGIAKGSARPPHIGMAKAAGRSWSHK